MAKAKKPRRIEMTVEQWLRSERISYVPRRFTKAKKQYKSLKGQKSLFEPSRKNAGQ